MFVLIAYLLLALIVSFLCSIMEAVLLSTPQSYLIVKKEEGTKWASGLLGYKSNVDRPLSAILTLNTVAHTVGAAGVGAQAIIVFGDAYFGAVSAILTILILVLTEIIPKTLGARMNKQLSKFAFYGIRIMIFMTYPLVLLSVFITKLFSANHQAQTVSREEIAALTSIGATEGLFSDKENKIIQNMLRLKNLRVNTIMTPRVVLVSANEDITLSEFMKQRDYLKFSRIPVYSDNEDNITGYVLRQSAFEKIADGQDNLKIRDIKREIVIVPYTVSLFWLWEILLEKKEHIALIVDEYGGVDGVVTMEDIIETLLGLEIVDEKDTITDMQKYAKERWKSRQAKYASMDEIRSDVDA
jgi:CBS domain containing-hemolysin-like protein